jgi:uncharacterized protein
MGGSPARWRRWRENRDCDPRGDIAVVNTAARAYSDTGWIIPHLSSFTDDWRAQVALVDQLTRLPNLFADTAGVRYFDIIVDAVRRAGPHKILFGSDGPLLHLGVEISKIHALQLPPPAAGLVLGRNILRLTRAARATVNRRARPSFVPEREPVEGAAHGR